MFALSKAVDLSGLLHGGQLYWAFPFSKGSLDKYSYFASNNFTRYKVLKYTTRLVRRESFFIKMLSNLALIQWQVWKVQQLAPRHSAQ
jgi:hypothetical protein